MVGRAAASPSNKHSISLRPTTIPGLRLLFANVPRKCNVPRKMQCTAQCLSRTFQLVVPREERDRSWIAPSLSMQTCVLRGSDTSNMSTLVCACVQGGHLGLGADAEPVGESACPPSCVLVKRTWSLDQQVYGFPCFCLLMQIYFPNISLV